MFQGPLIDRYIDCDSTSANNMTSHVISVCWNLTFANWLFKPPTNVSTLVSKPQIRKTYVPLENPCLWRIPFLLLSAFMDLIQCLKLAFLGGCLGTAAATFSDHISRSHLARSDDVPLKYFDT